MLDFTQILSTIENEEEYETADRIFTEYHAFMYRIAWSYVKNEAEAEDLVMDVASNICANISAFIVYRKGEKEHDKTGK